MTYKNCATEWWVNVYADGFGHLAYASRHAADVNVAGTRTLLYRIHVRLKP